MAHWCGESVGGHVGRRRLFGGRRAPGRAGHEVVGATLKLWGGASDSGCCSVADVDDARRVAQQLGIAHHVFNLSEEFDAAVVAPYVAAHGAGPTPNPCIECNRHIKFDRLLARSRRLGFDALATGHHARVAADGDRSPPAPRGGPGQGPVLRAVHAGPGRAGPGPPPGRGDDQGRRPGPRRPARAAHRGQARQPGRVLHRQPRARAGSWPTGSTCTPAKWSTTSGSRGRHGRGGRAGHRGPAPGHGPRPRRQPPLRGRGRRGPAPGDGRGAAEARTVDRVAWPADADLGRPPLGRRGAVRGPGQRPRPAGAVHRSTGPPDPWSCTSTQPQRPVAPGQTVALYDPADPTPSSAAGIAALSVAGDAPDGAPDAARRARADPSCVEPDRRTTTSATTRSTRPRSPTPTTTPWCVELRELEADAPRAGHPRLAHPDGRGGAPRACSPRSGTGCP